MSTNPRSDDPNTELLLADDSEELTRQLEAGRRLCKCCGKPFTPERAQGMGNVNMCVPCVCGVTELPAAPVRNEFPRGRWTEGSK